MNKAIKLLILVYRLLIATIALLSLIPIIITAIWILSGCYGGIEGLRDTLSCEAVLVTNAILSYCVITIGLLYHKEI
jgi:hypothetical protein